MANPVLVRAINLLGWLMALCHLPLIGGVFCCEFVNTFAADSFGSWREVCCGEFPGCYESVNGFHAHPHVCGCLICCEPLRGGDGQNYVSFLD